ncbi:MAG: sugar transporter, partial [Thermoplasmatales archaeon A-plasma]
MITVSMDQLPFGSMDRSPVTRSHWKIFTISSMGMFLNGYDLSVITLAMVVIPHQIGLSTEQYLAVNASAFAGMLMGAPLIGRLADRIGRRRIFGLDLILFVVFAILSGLSTNFLELFSFRFLLGLGIGGDYPVSSTMVSEFSPIRPR